jgi:bacillithiol system protein YtxJ
MNWKQLTEINQLAQIKEESKNQTVVIFKHSTRCSISAMALNRLEKNWDEKANKIIPYYLDLIAYRNISNQIAEDFKVYHESPQLLIIKNGECTFDASHSEIAYSEMLTEI